MSNDARATSIPGLAERGRSRLALGSWWLASRVALMALVVVAAALAGIGPETHPLRDGVWLFDRFAYWDSYHFVRIAEKGYLPPGLPCCDQAFYPGYPMLMALVRPVVGSVVLAGIVVSLVASTVAAAALAAWVREATGCRRAGLRAVVWLAAAPTGVFLTAVYTEATFLAFAVTAWLAASRRHWWLAGSLAALAAVVRVNGLFLLCGLAVMYAMQCRSARRRPGADVLSLGLPLLGVAAYVTYLHSRTDDWFAWQHAEAVGWDRHTATPWRGLADSLQAIGDASSGWSVVSRAADVLAVLGAVVTILVLARRRHWAEVAYLVPAVGVVACSTVWTSAPRYVLTWFPVFLVLSAVDLRGPRGRLILGLWGASAVLLTVMFATRHWVA